MKCWNKDAFKYYYEGIFGGSYPWAIMHLLDPILKDCGSMIDICSGPGAFSLYALENCWRVTAVDISSTALAALEAEARQYRRARLDTLCGDFLTLTPPMADVAVAAYCFSGEMAEKAALAKIADCGRFLAIYVTHDGPKGPEFNAADLPADRNAKSADWDQNNMEETLSTVAAEKGLRLHCHKLTCDFGCYYHEGDETFMAFISHKTRGDDRQLLIRHLQETAQPRNGRLWLANPKPLKVYWLEK